MISETLKVIDELNAVLCSKIPVFSEMLTDFEKLMSDEDSQKAEKNLYTIIILGRQQSDLNIETIALTPLFHIMNVAKKVLLRIEAEDKAKESLK